MLLARYPTLRFHKRSGNGLLIFGALIHPALVDFCQNRLKLENFETNTKRAWRNHAFLRTELSPS